MFLLPRLQLRTLSVAISTRTSISTYEQQRCDPCTQPMGAGLPATRTIDAFRRHQHHLRQACLWATISLFEDLSTQLHVCQRQKRPNHSIATEARTDGGAAEMLFACLLNTLPKSWGRCKAQSFPLVIKWSTTRRHCNCATHAFVCASTYPYRRGPLGNAYSTQSTYLNR